MELSSWALLNIKTFIPSVSIPLKSNYFFLFTNRHQEAIRSLLPEKIFFNVGQVIRLLQRPSSDVPRTTTPKSSTSTTFSPDSSTQSDISQTRPEDEENIETNLDNNDASKEDDKNEHFVSLEIEKLQGGASLSVVCLAAVDLVRVQPRKYIEKPSKTN